MISHKAHSWATAKPQGIEAVIGPSWCFAHGEPFPCEACAATPKFVGRCFDCKHEFVDEATGEAGAVCGCGGVIRDKGFYQYP